MTRPLRTDPCPNCQRHHAPPVCAHNPDAPCHSCGLPVGFCWTGDDGVIGGADGVCVFCSRGETRPCPRESAPVEAEEWLA